MYSLQLNDEEIEKKTYLIYEKFGVIREKLIKKNLKDQSTAQNSEKIRRE